MKKLLDGSVYERPTFEKKGEYELPKDITEWNEEILKNFFSDVPYAPKDAGVDVVINHIDENKGYAKGSVVVFYKNKQINFPIIVDNFKLFPFDVFIVKAHDDPMYMNCTEKNIKLFLMTDEVGEIKNMYDYSYMADLKTPGGVAPKTSVPLDQAYHDFVIQDQAMYNLRKLTWLKSARKEDLEKLALQLQSQPNVRESFVETTGDLIKQVIETAKERKEVPKTKRTGILDLSDVISAKQTAVTIDSEFLDANKLTPLKPPSICELRLIEYPSMEDFMSSGQSPVSRLQATKVGKPLAGIILRYKNIGDSDCPKCCGEAPSSRSEETEEEKRRRLSEPIDQVFISADGNFYMMRNDYQKIGTLFYGTEIAATTPTFMEKLIKGMAAKNLETFFSFRQDNHNDGADKSFNPSWLQNEGTQQAMETYNDRAKRYSGAIGNPEGSNFYSRKGAFVLFGAGNIWECAIVDDIGRVVTVDGRKVYVGKNCAIIPANVLSIQKVDTVESPMYKMVLGSCRNIYLIPENSVVLAKQFMKELSGMDVMEPSKSVKEVWDKAAISKVSVYLGKEGYRIDGNVMAPAEIVLGIEKNAEYGTQQALTMLRVLGVAPARGNEILKIALNRASEGGKVDVYGVNEDYINVGAFSGIEKNARKYEIMKKIAAELKLDLVKEASVIDDPESVDAVLSLNFINEDNLGDYVDGIQSMKRVISKLAGLLIASRMGLKDIDESAVRKAMDGLEKTVEGLEAVKLALGK